MAVASLQVGAGDLEDAAAHGLDKVRFVASTNPGMAPGPIAKIASGGELARFMLALKVSLAAEGSGGTLILTRWMPVLVAQWRKLSAVAYIVWRKAGRCWLSPTARKWRRGNHHWKVAKGVMTARFQPM